MRFEKGVEKIGRREICGFGNCAFETRDMRFVNLDFAWLVRAFDLL